MSPETHTLKLHQAQARWEAFRAEILHRIITIGGSLPASPESAPQWWKQMMSVRNAIDNPEVPAGVLDVLLEVEAHHVKQNVMRGRPEQNSKTLRLVRAAIAEIRNSQRS